MIEILKANSPRVELKGTMTVSIDAGHNIM